MANKNTRNRDKKTQTFMDSEIDYSKIAIPSDKEPKDYTYTERRAEILELIRAKGHPKAVSQTKLAKYYNVSQPSIHRDMEALAEYFRTFYGRSAHFVVESVIHNAIRKLQTKEDYKGAVGVMKIWLDWLFSTGRLEKSPEKIEIKERVSYEDIKDAYDRIIKKGKDKRTTTKGDTGKER